MRKAFTLIDMLVAVAIMAMVMAMVGVVFRVGIEAYRLSVANAEIMRQFRVISDQLDADFRGLDKSGQIVVVYPADDDPTDGEVGESLYADRIMFFSRGDFQVYDKKNNETVVGHQARISYMLARRRATVGGSIVVPEKISPAVRRETLVRSQHILTHNAVLPDVMLLRDTLAVEGHGKTQWQAWQNQERYDKLTVKEWNELPLIAQENILPTISALRYAGDSTVSAAVMAKDPNAWGTLITTDAVTMPNTLHLRLAENVSEFRVQGWHESTQRWVPDDDPDNNGYGDSSKSDSHLLLDPDRETPGGSLQDPNTSNTPHILYPYVGRPIGEERSQVHLGGEFAGNDHQASLTPAGFNTIPGLGRALKFSFRLHDSQGLIEGGRAFTHIIYLDR